MRTRSFLAAVVVFLPVFTGHSAEPEVWGKSPEASDDRFSNPAKPLYAGPDGWWNMGEGRAAAKGGPKFQFRGSLTENSGLFIAVKDLLTLTLDFGSEKRPAPGEYRIGPKGDVAEKTVRFSFANVGGGVIAEWVSQTGAGTLTVKLVHGFTVFTCRDVALQGVGGGAKSLTLGFEGALSPE